MTKKTYKGFTLVELLVVIAILSILSTLGIANFQSARTKARDLARKSDLQTITKSLEAYVNDHRVYPSSNAYGQIICQAPTSTVCDWGSEFKDEKGTTYAIVLPNDTYSTYDYFYVSSGSSFSLYAHLENTNDPAIRTFSPPVYCGGSNLCNYKVTSSNIQ